jgi:N-acetylglucosamine kinase-like BadF-type ATPase
VILLGVDGGGTHTRALLVDGTGRVLGRGSAGATNQATVGGGAAAEGLARAVGAALAAAGVGPGAVDAACFGLAGLDRPVDEGAFREAVDRLGLRGPVLLVNDAVNAWAGATGGQPGIAVNAGTGSVAYGRGPDGRAARAGGWGSPFGDEGSAYWIACQAVGRVLRGLDGREPPAAMAADLARAAGFEDPADLCLLARLDRLEPGVPLEAALGRLAPTVVACAEAGDREAAGILDRAAEELARHALAIARAVAPPEAPPPVYGLGSVLLPPPGEDATPVGRRMDRLLRAWGLGGLQRPRHSALVGAVVLAWEAVRPGEPVPEDLAASWGRVG